MYAYEWDDETGGLLLNSSPLIFSKEPRPVYYKELDILGFDKHWDYAKDDTSPFMWAEANAYWYRGRKVAQTKGGSLYTPPEIVILEEPEPNGAPLQFINIPAMVAKNRIILEILAQETIKKVYNTYIQHKEKVDVFYVAFSGGKDSIATLDIVQKALPHNAFKVLFGDTGMEFPDTYSAVDFTEQECKKQCIDFIRAKSDLSPAETWKQFGPPATVTRWCCSVHKTAPQVIALREKIGKADFTGMAFIGIRASESLSRSEYDYVSLGEKHKGQYSCNPILEWNSAELYLYIYSENLFLNEAYKKGNRRAGCLVCPRAAERNDYMSRVWYPNEFETYIDTIRALYQKSIPSPLTLEDFIANGGWKARKNGRDISIDVGYSEAADKEYQILKIRNPKTDWKIWIKTIGVLLNNESPYKVVFRNQKYSFKILAVSNGYDVYFESSISKLNPLFVKLLKNVFRKSTCCIMCRECEADCHNGCISMKNGIFEIGDECVHCSHCHKVDKGCLVYKSLEMPKGGLKMSTNKSLNCYSHHAPKRDWFTQFFTYRNDFDQKHSLGSQMYSFYKRFLRDSELLDENGFSNTASVIDRIGLDELISWAILLVNLAHTPQINWYVKRMNMYETYNKDYTLS